MKKLKLILLCFICFLAVGCGSKDSKDVGNLENFKNVCINNGFSIIDKMDEYANEDANYITGAIQATLDDITIEMVQYDNSDNASKIQEQHIKNFMGMKSTGASAKKEKGENYYKFSLISNGYYMVSSRIDNTLIFSKTLLNNKEKVETILNDMNY